MEGWLYRIYVVLENVFEFVPTCREQNEERVVRRNRIDLKPYIKPLTRYKRSEFNVFFFLLIDFIVTCNKSKLIQTLCSGSLYPVEKRQVKGST